MAVSSLIRQMLDQSNPVPKAEKIELEPAELSTAHAEYARIAQSIGFTVPNLPDLHGEAQIERFKAFLRMKDWPVFRLEAVIKYMDKKAQKESDEKAGWHWCPLRRRDHISYVKFGRDHERDLGAFGWYFKNPKSDYYEEWNCQTYNKLVPLHALRKVAEIEAEFKEPVSFFVCDYAPAPRIQHPDPFLMAVIRNSNLEKGHGRFVIDFWDEPGFGINEQLGS